MKADMTCLTCRHWDRDNEEDMPMSKMADVRVCTRAVMFWDATEWVEVDDDYGRLPKPEFATHRMFVQDGSDYKAYLITRPQFSCAEWEGLS